MDVDRRVPGTGPARRRGPARRAFRGKAVESPQPAPSRQTFEDFFRDAYRPLLRDVIIFAGGNPHEAEDALCAAMTEVLQRWNEITNPRAYARRATISNLIKNKQRGMPRIVDRLIKTGDVTSSQERDPGLTAWEEREWVTLVLKSLPSAQREVLAYAVDEFTPKEIAQLLGKTETGVRQNLCAARRRLASFLAEGDT